MDWALPPNYSTQGIVIDQLFWIILVITGIAFILVEGGILWFCLKYRGREGARAHYTHGSNRLEVIWTVVPAIIIAILGVYSAAVWQDIKSQSNRPQDALQFLVVGKQYEWNITYPGPDRKVRCPPDPEDPDRDPCRADNFIVRNQFHFPANEMVTVLLESEDVIHSFFIPELRVKQDAVPGMTIPIWFDSTQPGDFEIACAELCGLGHYYMQASVTVHSAADFDAWLAGQATAQ
ncbi:cytochrome c oxidase subunit II [Candidatus Palauibacter sp.]|uniref:cytochrome c oxidase subunit II n=1 Tax=Candidatus Palauibacter sp. TaxID=3101350 RepID=UPI003AF2934E